MTQKIPILILIDCEPDARETKHGISEPWRGFEIFHAFLSSWRETISERTRSQAQFAWFWRADPQIEATYVDASWAIRTYARQIDASMRYGDGLGLHTHAWRWDAAVQRWITDHGNPGWIDSCVEMSFDTFKRCFGKRCRLFRFGDGWLDNATVQLIERLGAQIDLTLEPGSVAKGSLASSELATGRIPDRRMIPTLPYHPSRKDFRVPDTSGTSTLWMMPVSTGRIPLSGVSSLREVFSSLLMPHTRTVALNLGFEPKLFRHLFGKLLRAGGRRYITVCARTDIGANKGLFDFANKNLSWLLHHPISRQFVFMSPEQAIDHLGTNRLVSTAPSCERVRNMEGQA